MELMNLRTCFVLLLAGFAWLGCSKQQPSVQSVDELPYSKIDLDNFDQWKIGNEDATWKLVSQIGSNALMYDEWITEGSAGILYLDGTGDNVSLNTVFTHKDIDLKCEFMLSSKANLSLVFQGLHEISLRNSWRAGKGSLLCGLVLDTLSPKVNACKAPGLWQTLHIRYTAPVVDSSGKPLSAARFEEVVLNGTVIHKNVLLSSLDKSATTPGPLKVVGHAGPAALRNIEYKSYSDDRIQLVSSTYRVYKGLYKKYDTLTTLTPVRTGNADSLHWGYGDKRAQIVFESKVKIPTKGDYLFRLRAGGPAWVLIDGKEVVDNDNTRDYGHPFHGKVELTAGEHDLSVIYANYDESLVVEYEGPNIALTALTVQSSERKHRPVPPLELAVETSPVVQRGFLKHGNAVNRYAISVGSTNGIHYAYDLTTFNILSVWRGGFIDVSNMWVERGEPQLQVPQGAVLELLNIPPLLSSAAAQKGWIDTVSVEENIYTKRGYKIGANGLPVFNYSYNGCSVEDRVETDSAINGVGRIISITSHENSQELDFLVSRGDKIEGMSDGAYAINDREYYVYLQNVSPDQVQLVTTANGKKEIRLRVHAPKEKKIEFTYLIIW